MALEVATYAFGHYQDDNSLFKMPGSNVNGFKPVMLFRTPTNTAQSAQIVQSRHLPPL